MFKLEIPNVFLNADCPKCRMRHAPIRDCLDSEGNKLYFDAVLLKGSRTIVFNGTPEETRLYLLDLPLPDRAKLTVFRGQNLHSYTAEEYLDL